MGKYGKLMSRLEKLGQAETNTLPGLRVGLYNSGLYQEVIGYRIVDGQKMGVTGYFEGDGTRISEEEYRKRLEVSKSNIENSGERCFPKVVVIETPENYS